MGEKLRVGVIFGGRSGEHEVSLASAASVMVRWTKRSTRSCPLASHAGALARRSRPAPLCKVATMDEAASGGWRDRRRR